MTVTGKPLHRHGDRDTTVTTGTLLKTRDTEAVTVTAAARVANYDKLQVERS